MSETKDWGKEAFVSFFFLGKSPVAPGTFGSFGALVLAYFAIENIESFVGYLLLFLAAIMYYIGVQIAPWCEEKYGKDPGIYVIDEVIGYLIPIGLLVIFEIDIKLALKYTLLTKGNFNNSSAMEIPLASFNVFTSMLLCTSILFATNFITSGFGVLSAYIL